MKLTFLGTGTSQGVPMIGCDCQVCRSADKRDKRLRSSVMIDTDEGQRIVIDTGPDFRYQMLRENVKGIDAVLFTHDHKDHTGGLDDVRAFNYFMDAPAQVYCEAYVRSTLEKDYDYAFAEKKYPGAPEITLHTITEEPFFIGATEIIPVRGWHYRLPVLGYRIGCMAYLTDMNRIDESELNKLQGIEVLVINALRHQEHISHFTVEQALGIIRKVHPRRAYLTHASHQFGKYADMEKLLPENVFPAYDRLTVLCK